MNRALKICLLSYRSNPHCGGQGVYIKNLSRALADLGHCVAVVSGPPSLHVDDDIRVHRLPSLDLYDPHDPFRMPSLKELRHPLNLIEWLGVSTMGFPEPFIFGIRAYLYLKQNAHRYDIVHDNQSLSYGIWAIKKILPTVATIHHPITVDRNIAIREVSAPWRKMKQLRWYSFIGMQKRVARTLPHIITVSKCARTDISRDFKIPLQRFRIAPNGIDTEQFHPIPSIQREKNRIIVTNSADTPLKGLYYLLQAIAQISRSKPVHLIVVGQPKKNGSIEKLVGELVELGEAEFPPIFVDMEIDWLIGQQLRRWQMIGKGLDDYLKSTNKTEEEVREELRPLATKRVTQSLTLDRIAEEEKFEVSDSEISAEIENMTKSATENKDELNKFLNTPQARKSIEQVLITRKTIQRLVEIAKGSDKNIKTQKEEQK